MINLLLVENSIEIQNFLTRVFKETGIHVIATASNGVDAISATKKHKPHIILMDIHLPEMNGLEATRIIMEKQATPIIIMTSFEPEDVETTFRAVKAGALTVVKKPTKEEDHISKKTVKDLIHTIKIMSEIKVVGRKDSHPKITHTHAAIPHKLKRSIEIVAIGASTGGQAAIETILSHLPKNFPVPILIVLHISSGFINGLANWLTESTGFPVHVASHGEIPFAGHAYLAPDGTHLGINSSGHLLLNLHKPENGFRPAISYMFRTVADVFKENAVGIMLTGMGRDGVDDLKRMNSFGAMTIAQDKESCVVFGMPGEAIKCGAVNYVLPPKKIADLLIWTLVQCGGTLSETNKINA